TNSAGRVRSCLVGCAGGVRRVRTTSPVSSISPWRCKRRRCSRFSAIEDPRRLVYAADPPYPALISARTGGGKVQGRRDSNPQPPVLETGALPIELLPFEGSVQRTTGRNASRQRHVTRIASVRPV